MVSLCKNSIEYRTTVARYMYNHVELSRVTFSREKNLSHYTNRIILCFFFLSPRFVFFIAVARFYSFCYQLHTGWVRVTWNTQSFQNLYSIFFFFFSTLHFHLFQDWLQTFHFEFDKSCLIFQSKTHFQYLIFNEITLVCQSETIERMEKAKHKTTSTSKYSNLSTIAWIDDIRISVAFCLKTFFFFSIENQMWDVLKRIQNLGFNSFVLFAVIDLQNFKYFFDCIEYFGIQ